MSGDVQPRKRKDKKKKKDDLGIEEPRGTAAVLGEGDVFMHSQHDHGTGGHWCAKIIFFSLLAVLITLIGLIILENRGLTELEANSVESRYSGVLEGWLEDAADDDHHDEHTLELKHPDDDDIEDHTESDQPEDLEDEEHEDDEDEHDEDEHDEDEHEDDEDEHEDDEDPTELDEDEIEQDNDENDDDNDESLENLEESNEEEIDEKITYNRYNYDEDKYKIDENDDDEVSQEIEEDNLSTEIDENNDDNDDESDEEDKQNEQGDEDADDEENERDEQDENDEQDEHDELDDDEDENNDERDEVDDEDENDEQDDDTKYQAIEQEDASEERDDEETMEQIDDDIEEDEEEIEHIEREVSDDIEDSEEAPLKASLENKEYENESKEDEEEDADDQDFLEADDDEPPIERITTPPAGRPFVEIEEETTEKPIDTLAEEEEYERRQEELRREEAQASHMWLKLAVGGALLVATHAVLRRATAPADAPETEEQARSDSPSLTDRRMTLISEEQATNVPQERPPPPPAPRPLVEEEIFKKPAPVMKSAPVLKDIEQEVKTSGDKRVPEEKDDEEKELYSDDEEVEEEEEEEEEIVPTKVTPQQKSPITAPEQKDEESEPEEVPDDVEIIDDEQIEEEEEEEDEDEEEISDVDDTELLSRLEAKYGRLPEPERPGKYIHKEGGNSIEDEWPGEPSESYWREQLDIAEDELRQGDWASCEKRVSSPALAASARARWLAARALDAAAEQKRDNRLLSRAIAAYLHLLKMNERLPDKKLLDVARRTIDRIQFRGTYLNAEPIYRLLIRRFPNNVDYRNNLTISFLMANRADLADEVLKETLRLWPDDRVALAHRGFVLKNHYNKLEEAVIFLRKALEGDAGAANEARFYYHLGDALLQLGRSEEANEVHRRGADLGHFPSPAQRSLYNVPRLRSRPWWPVEETPYAKLAAALERSWREILKEGEAAKALYEKEKEGLMDRGQWSQLELFVRGRELPGRCARAPATCAAVRAEPAAAGCRRGQVKFSAMDAGTHVRAHVGPTNCRLRLHLALSNTDGTYIRVHDEIRQWQVGKAFIFDDSFEHEVWHNGTGTRLVLIVDVWHPDLTAAERRQLPAI